jgi:hypothetical protein
MSRQHQIAELADLDPVFAEIGLVADKADFLQHQLDADGGCVILNQQDAHFDISQCKGSVQRVAALQRP